MRLKTKIGQIFLTHPKDQNYTSIYTESFTKHGQNVELFVAIEIAHRQEAIVRARRAEYDKLAQTLVTTFKKTYVGAVDLDQDFFEKSLASINLAISRLAQRGKIGWYGRLNVAMAAVVDNQMFLSATGNALAYLIRNGDFTLLSEGLSDQQTKTTKIFSNYSSGRLTAGDRVILTTNQLFNFLSLERMDEFLKDEPLKSACSDIIAALDEIKDTGFSTFIFEVAGENEPAQRTESVLNSAIFKEREPSDAAAAASGSAKAAQIAWHYLKTFLKYAGAGLSALAAYLIDAFRKRSKKPLLAIIGIIVLLLLANLGYSYYKKKAHPAAQTPAGTLDQVESDLTAAEAKLIYKDQNTAATLVSDAEGILAGIAVRKQDQARRDAINKRISDIKGKINNEVTVNNPNVLTQFPNIPTDIIRSPNGVLAFNKNSGSVAFYDFRVGTTKPLLKNQNTGSLLVSAYAGNPNGFVFLDRNGKIQSLDLTAETLKAVTADPIIANFDQARVKDMKILGAGANARAYILETGAGQIWRSKATATGFATAEKWLKADESSLTQSASMAVDGSIYILFSDRADKYFSGQKQAAFSLAKTIPPLSGAQKIYTTDTLQNIYVQDPENSRIIIFDKQGKVVKIVKSNKFRDLADIYVDEKNSIIYAASGNELLQVNY
ncbi:hypothetical protein D4R52_03565 [bacterium]|nr:MAG: hypothetical protein D4R52_03565 [bacterium]